MENFQNKKHLMRTTVIQLALPFLITSCGESNLKQVTPERLIGGNKVGMETLPAAVSIWIQSGNTRQLCTGTFVSDNALLTAAHCMYQVDRSTGAVGATVLLRDQSDRPAIKTFANIRATGVSAYDIALAIFPDGTSDHSLPVADEMPQTGARVEMLGYGSRRVWNGSDHERSAGTNIISGFWNEMIVTRRSGSGSDQVAASPGDSGGPMILDGRIAGVSSGGSGGRESYHAPVALRENLEWLNTIRTNHGARISGLN